MQVRSEVQRLREDGLPVVRGEGKQLLQRPQPKGKAVNAASFASSASADTDDGSHVVDHGRPARQSIRAMAALRIEMMARIALSGRRCKPSHALSEVPPGSRPIVEEEILGSP